MKKIKFLQSHAYEGILERLTQLENNFTLLLSRGEIHPYASLEEALRAPSRFSQLVNVKVHLFNFFI